MWRFLSSYRDVYDKAHDLLERAAFLDRKDTEVRYLSHGEQRQLEIVLGSPAIRTFCCSTSRPPACRRASRLRWRDSCKNSIAKMAILLIEHDMDIVFDVADEISVLHFGEVLESGSAERIRSSAKVQEIYLGTG